MSHKDKWLEEYTDIVKSDEFKDSVAEIEKIIDEILSSGDIKYNLNKRIKSEKSLSEKIKRNQMDKNPENQNKSLLEILDDFIGIRIVCIKNDDESKILNLLRDNQEKLSLKNLKLNASLYEQPKTQKNGHEIYKLKACYKGVYQVELQIKSLTNLLWGEVEHLLFYKNNKYLINYAYYKYEMESIYKELEIIDHKITYMENIMISENDKYYIKEKKEVLKRLLYTTFKEQFYKAQENEYLNNNHVFEGVTNLLFERKKSKKKSGSVEKQYNEVYRMAMSNLLSDEKKEFQFTNKLYNELIELNAEYSDEFETLIYGIICDETSGWWHMILLTILLEKKEDLFTINIDKEMIKRKIDKIIKLINIKMFGEVSQIEGENLKSTILQRLKLKQINYYADKKDMRWTREAYCENYNANAKILVDYILINGIDELSEEESGCVIKLIVEILSVEDYGSTNIAKYLQQINKQIALPNSYSNGEFVSLNDFCKQV